MAGRILVLDDEENYAEMLKELLCEHNYIVDMATRPERAVSLLEEIPYDLVISDYKMPVMDGADFLQRARELYPKLPFILVSGLMNTPELVKVANMGVTLVLEKPLNSAYFLEQVAKFSTPMTDAEKASYEEKLAAAKEASAAQSSYPEAPRFFSAASPESKRFLEDAWSIVSKGNALYMMQSRGGDAELVARELSHWKGNGDLPITAFFLPDSVDNALEQVKVSLGDAEESNTILVRLQSIAQLSAARSLVSRAREEIGSSELLLIFVLSIDKEKAFNLEVSDLGVVLPPLSARPSDLAVYAKRFARVAAERAGKEACANFSDEAAYLLLANDWAGDYKQLQGVILNAVGLNRADLPIGLDEMKVALGSAFSGVDPDERLESLMLSSQTRYLLRACELQDMTPMDLAKALEIDEFVENEEDLKALPLIKNDLL